MAPRKHPSRRPDTTRSERPSRAQRRGTDVRGDERYGRAASRAATHDSRRDLECKERIRLLSVQDLKSCTHQQEHRKMHSDFEKAHLSVLRLLSKLRIRDINPHILPPLLVSWPPQRLPMQLREPSALHRVPDHGDALWVAARDSAEARDRE